MRIYLLVLVVALSTPPVIPDSSMAKDLSQYAWRNRLLTVFTPTAQDAKFVEQRALLEGEQRRLSERELVIIEIIGEEVLLSGESAVIEDANSLRERFGVKADEFAVRLVGKDTGVKLRSDSPLVPAQLYALIDAMPMRLREMKERAD